MSAPLSIAERMEAAPPGSTEPEAEPEAELDASHELPDFIHQLIRDFIVYADQKGAFVFLAATTLLGYLVGAGATESVGRAWSTWQLHDWIGIAAMVLASTTSLLGAAVFAPGHRPRKRGTILDWREFPHDQGEDAYVAEIEGLTRADARAEVLRHCHTLGTICRNKHRILDLAFRLGFFALAATIAYGVVS